MSETLRQPYEEVDEVVETAAQEQVEPEAYDIDSLFQVAVDEEADTKAAESLLLEKGKYVTMPPSVSIAIAKRDKEPNKGRLVARVFGPVTEPGGDKAIGRAAFNLSPVPVYKDNGKADASTKLWLQAKSAAKKAGAYDGSVGSVFAYLRDYPVQVFVVKLEGNEEYPDPSNFVTSIQMVR